MTRVWVWVGHMGLDERIQLVLAEYGDRITDISIFGWSVSAAGRLTETFDPTQLDPYREAWPHIRFWGCFRNMDDADDGPFEIFEALRDSETARQQLADDVAAMFDQYPWLSGVDIDLETGGDERSEESELIFQTVADRAHSLGKLCGAALPPLTATGSVGGENWVRYAELGRILDVVEIMSYDFAWAGSAPGPISPGFWMEDVYNWVSSQIEPSKVHMGVPLYAYYWRLHDYPPELGNPWRGLSGTYYSFWQQFNGVTDWYPGEQPTVGWIAYRDPESRSLWGFLHAYDWQQPGNWDSYLGVDHDIFQGKHYGVRYGLPGGTPLWTIADNSAGDARAEYTLRPEEVVDVAGELAGPFDGFTFTLEMLKREPVGATIIDDYATSEDQLGTVYRLPDGDDTWQHEAVTDTYRQYRGAGRLEYNNDFGSDALFIQGRAQFATAGTFSVYSQGFEAELRNDGRIRLLRDGEEIDTAWVAPRTVGLSPQQGQAVLALRVREESARVYFSISEEGRADTVIEVTGTSAPGGPTGYDATATMWMDHAYLGDGWWYQPREAVEVTLNGESRVMGRYGREGITWAGENNMFRPDEDVDESETRTDEWTEYSIMDWGYEHWTDAPITLGAETDLRITPTDHDVWWGRIIVFDRAGGFIAYCNDAQAVAYWRGRARNDWALAGVAMWSLGQEDVRLWDVLEGGEFPAGTKILDG